MTSCGIGGMWIEDREIWRLLVVTGLEVDCFCFSQSRGLGRIQNGGIVVLLPAAVVACCDPVFGDVCMMHTHSFPPHSKQY